MVKIDPLASIYETYLGPSHVLRLKVESGSGFKSEGRLIKDTPDLYASVRFGANPVWHTSTRDNDNTPEWNETRDFLFSDNDQEISLDIVDSDIGIDERKGSAKISVGKLMDAGKRSTLPVVPADKDAAKEADSSATVTISAEALKLVPDAASLGNPAEEGAKTCNGLLTVLVAGAKGLAGKREDLSSQVTLECGEQTGATPCVIDAPGVDCSNPNFDFVFRVLLTPEIIAAKHDVKMNLKNKGDSVGQYSFSVDEILAAPELTMESQFPVATGGVLMAKAFIQGTAGN